MAEVPEVEEIVEIPIERRTHSLFMGPKLTVAISCGKEKANAMTACWAMPLSFTPPLVGVAIAPRRYSYNLIKESGEFVINLPSWKNFKALLYLGRKSGRFEDKISSLKLRTKPAKHIAAPLLLDFDAWLECRVVKEIETGDHSFFVAEVLRIAAKKDVLDGVSTTPERIIYWRDASNERDVWQLAKREPQAAQGGEAKA